MGARIYTIEPNIQLGLSNTGEVYKLFNTSSDTTLQFKAQQTHIYIFLLSLAITLLLLIFYYIKSPNENRNIYSSR